MGKDRILTLKDGDKLIGDVELICAFKILGFVDNYIIYTKNEKDIEGNTIIYSGKIKDDGDRQYLVNIEEGIEWEKLKTIMRSMAKYSLDGEKSYV